MAGGLVGSSVSWLVCWIVGCFLVGWLVGPAVGRRWFDNLLLGDLEGSGSSVHCLITGWDMVLVSGWVS